MDQTTKRDLALKAAQVRLNILEAVHAAKSGHPGGSLLIAEVITYLYNKEMKVDPKNPNGQTATVWCFLRVTPPPHFTLSLPSRASSPARN